MLLVDHVGEVFFRGVVLKNLLYLLNNSFMFRGGVVESSPGWGGFAIRKGRKPKHKSNYETPDNA